MSDASFAVMNAVETIATRKTMRGMLNAFRDRFGKLGFDLMLSAACIVPGAREYLDSQIEKEWENAGEFGGAYQGNADIIVGSGPSAAIYAAIRHQVTGVKPFVIEMTKRPGGTFALTRNPGWLLNSANRAGNGIGRPGMNGQTNYLPGASIQMSDLGMAEYQPNTDLAFVTRLSLAQNARVFPNTFADDINADSGSVLANGLRVYTNARLIVATGLGNENGITDAPIFTFNDYMRRLDSPFPFRDWQSVAVIGDGDGGKVVIESLLGIGPAGMPTILSMDTVRKIDWYGRNVPDTKSEWRNVERSRYLRIGKYLGNRVEVINERGYAVKTGRNSAAVNSRNYDAVILCTGYNGGIADELFSNYSFENYTPIGSNDVLARKASYSSTYVIGPAANLSLTNSESREEWSSFAGNRNAIFRYAGRNAALATIV